MLQARGVETRTDMLSGIWLCSYVALWTLIALLSVVLVLVMRQVTRLHSFHVKTDPAWGLQQGEPAPSIQRLELIQTGDGPLEHFDYYPGRSNAKVFTAIIFISPTCLACRAMAKC